MPAAQSAKSSARLRDMTPPLFLFEGTNSLTADLGLPPTFTNVFQRLIRNPRIDSAYAKERECTEMLCALLLNCPTLRHHLFQWMARPTGLPAERLNDLVFSIDTEQSIGKKRDDLRIVGRSREAADPFPVLIWTVEVKVGSWFHESSQQTEEGPSDFATEERLPVNQLLNYDLWLSTQQASHRAGFVLAIYDHARDLPESLACAWTCLTWTKLGEQIAEALRHGKLTGGEQCLSRHALGFIQDNLWRTSEMTDIRLNYNDISLIRAYAAIADDCEAKAERLVASLAEDLEHSGIGEGKISRPSSLFGTGGTSISRELSGETTIYVGIGGDFDTGEDYLSVWLQTPPKHPSKAALHVLLTTLSPKLHERNARWRHKSHSDDPNGSGWVDLEIAVPLLSLLIAEDQVSAAKEFVKAALGDLAAIGFDDSIAKLVGRASNSKRK